METGSRGEEFATIDPTAAECAKAHIGKNRGNDSGEVMGSMFLSLCLHGSLIMLPLMSSWVAFLLRATSPPPPPINHVAVKIIELPPPPPPPPVETHAVPEISSGEGGGGVVHQGIVKTKSKRRKGGGDDELHKYGLLGVLRAKDDDGGAIASIIASGELDNVWGDNVYGGLIGSEVGETHGVGGLGLRGSGEGGGGRGLGLGGLGTGRGSGSFGVGRAAPAVVGASEVEGELDPAIVRRHLRVRSTSLRACGEKARLADPQFAGRYRLTLQVAEDGSVSSAVLEPGGPELLRSCVVEVMMSSSFPKPRTGEVTIRTHLTYSVR